MTQAEIAHAHSKGWREHTQWDADNWSNGAFVGGVWVYIEAWYWGTIEWRSSKVFFVQSAVGGGTEDSWESLGGTDEECW
jgi:hypothetical protein